MAAALLLWTVAGAAVCRALLASLPLYGTSESQLRCAVCGCGYGERSWRCLGLRLWQSTSTVTPVEPWTVLYESYVGVAHAHRFRAKNERSEDWRYDLKRGWMRSGSGREESDAVVHFALRVAEALAEEKLEFRRRVFFAILAAEGVRDPQGDLWTIILKQHAEATDSATAPAIWRAWLAARGAAGAAASTRE